MNNRVSALKFRRFCYLRKFSPSKLIIIKVLPLVFYKIINIGFFQTEFVIKNNPSGLRFAVDDRDKMKESEVRMRVAKLTNCPLPVSDVGFHCLKPSL